MKRLAICFVMAGMIVCCANAAMAIPMLYSYDITADGFYRFLGSGTPTPPDSSIHGKVQLILDPANGAAGTGSSVYSIDLTIGNHTYTADEVGYQRYVSSDGRILIGANVDGINRMFADGVGDDFFISGNIQGLGYQQYVNNRFQYVVDGIQAAYTAPVTIVETISSIPEDPDPVPTPEPSTFLLLGGGLVGIYFIRKRLAG